MSMRIDFDLSLHIHFAEGLKHSDPYPPKAEAVVSKDDFPPVYETMRSWPGYRMTPLHSLTDLAMELGIERLWYKDESTRFGFGSFKPLGAGYAVYRLLADAVKSQIGAEASVEDLAMGKYKDITKHMTVACATDGNHGRAVAWAAQKFHANCVVYIHSLVSQEREKAIATYGAEVRRIKGNYDDAVHEAGKVAAENDWTIVSDTSYPGYDSIPKDVMRGYGVMVQESLEQIAPTYPTHVFIQAGVGAMAAGVMAHLWLHAPKGQRPTFIIVEPDKAACLLESAKAGERTDVKGDLDTIMAGLACGEVSMLAWDVIAPGADAYISLPDEAARLSMRLLADHGIVAGESAVAGLAALLALEHHPDARKRLQLDSYSRVMIYGSEGDTDQHLYEQIVGKSAAEILSKEA